MGQTIHDVVGQAWAEFQQQVVAVVPHLMASAVVMLIGVLLGMLVRRLARWALRSTRLDQHAARLGLDAPLEAVGIRSAVQAASVFLQVSIILLASTLALYSLDARLASDLTERFLLYLPHLIIACGMLGGGLVLARFLGRSALIAAVNAGLPSARLLAGLTRVAVALVSAAIALEQLGIGRLTMLVAFAILFGGATLTAAIAVGVPLQEVVRGWMGRQFDQPPAGAPEETLRHW
jgi:hypothetical protein